MIRDDLSGITAPRRYIAQYVQQNKESLPLDFQGDFTVISDYCVAPDRAEKKYEWNQWKLGSYLNSKG